MLKLIKCEFLKLKRKKFIPLIILAAFLTGFVKGEDGFSIFIKAIPYNYYALFTIIAMVTLVILQADFGPMAKHPSIRWLCDLRGSACHDSGSAVAPWASI